MANILCKIWERWVNIAAPLLQPVGLIAKRMKVLTEKDMGQTHHKYLQQYLSSVMIRCNQGLNESLRNSLLEEWKSYGGGLVVPVLLSVCVV